MSKKIKIYRSKILNSSTMLKKESNQKLTRMQGKKKEIIWTFFFCIYIVCFVRDDRTLHRENEQGRERETTETATAKSINNCFPTHNIRFSWVVKYFIHLNDKNKKKKQITKLRFTPIFLKNIFFSPLAAHCSTNFQ